MAVKRAPKKPLRAKEPEPELDDEEPEDEEEPEEDEGEEEAPVKAKGKDGKVSRTKAERKVKDPLVRLKKEPEAKYGGAQVQGILKCLQENDEEMKLSDLIEKLPDYIKTSQPVGRIFAFYKRNLENAGVIEVV